MRPTPRRRSLDVALAALALLGPVLADVGRAAPAAAHTPSTVTTEQYTLTNSDGVTWVPVDAATPSKVTTAVSPVVSSMALVTGNADLWTWTPGFNQDLAIFQRVNGAGNWTMVAWKESGGFAGTFSPNAASVQALVPVTGGSTYEFQLRWKTNKGGASKISAGAGPIWDAYSPTSIAARLVPAAQGAVSTEQYSLADSDGVTWWPMDAADLTTTVAPAADGTAVVTANADLWTWTAGFNQDLAIFQRVDGAGDWTMAAWKESGGFAGTFSPNAAFVQANVAVEAGRTYEFQVRWKANKAGTSTISAGAGSNPYSPTSIIASVQPATSSRSFSKVSTQQYSLTTPAGSTPDWSVMDTGGGLTLNLPASSVACSALVTANADLWTWEPGFNQDLSIWARPAGGSYGMAAWKESGGFAGTFSPNAAAVQAVVPLEAGKTYDLQLRWKPNKAGASKISAGAGPISSLFSPTSIVAQTAECDHPQELLLHTTQSAGHVHVYSPDVLVAEPGPTRVVVRNIDGEDHSFTAPSLAVNTVVPPGEERFVDFVMPTGTVDFHCTFHAEMVGQLVNP